MTCLPLRRLRARISRVSFARPLGDHVQVRLPHVRADEADQCGTRRAEPQEEFPQMQDFL
jgi:hypothetical protein